MNPSTQPSIEAAITFISLILNKYGLLQAVDDPDDEELLHEVLKKHPRVLEKTRGLAIVRFEVHPHTGGNPCFYFYREDGTRDHFGFQKCVRNAARA